MYVSRAHEIEIRPSSVRLSVESIISEVIVWISFKFELWPYAQDFFYDCFSFSLTWDPMGAKISKRYSSYKSQPKVFKLFLNFPPNGPHKSMFGIFEILKIEILTNFIRFR